MFKYVGIGLILVFFNFGLSLADAATSTVTIQPDATAGKDTSYGTYYYTSGQPNSEYAHIGGWGDEYYSYLQFVLPSIPAEAEIVEAKLYLYQDIEGRSYNEAKVLKITEDWTESGVTSSNNPTSTDPGLGWIPAPSVIGWWEADVTPIVEGWIEDEDTNYGLKIDGRYNSTNHVRRYLTSDHTTDPTLRPKLVITYNISEVVIQPNSTSGKDTTYGTYYHTGGQPNFEYAYIGGWGDEYFSYFKFDLTTLPTDLSIEEAKLYLYQDLATGNANNVKVLTVTEDWTESGVTSSNNPTSTDPGLGWISVPAVAGWLEVDMSSIVDDWVNEVEPNYGIKLDGQLTCCNYVRRFLTSDHVTDPSLRPKLVITY